MFRLFVPLFAVCWGLQAFAADKPSLEHFFPAAGQRGATNEINFFGKFEPWPPKAWASKPGIEFQFSTNKGKAQCIIAADAPAGACLVRLYNDQGASDTRIFVVSEEAETLEAEPNNHFARPQALTNLQTTVNGRLEKNGDVDSFSFSIKAGQWLDARLDSYTLMAKLDPVLRLVTTNGYQLAWNHDFATLDPRIVWQAPYDLEVVLQVFGFVYPADSDIRLSGGPSGVYRLHLALASNPPADLLEKVTEAEPNNDSDAAAAIELPGKMIGVISPERDVDRFKVVLKKDQEIEVRVRAAALGSVLDPWVAVEDAKGKELSRNDDADNSRDPKIEWKAPEDGTYYLAVGSTTHQGSSDCRYHLVPRILSPDYQMTSTADELALTSGTTNTLKLNFKRLRGFTNELAVAAQNLPADVQLLPVTVPSKDGEVVLSFVASTNALPANTAFSIAVTDNQSNDARLVPFELVSRTENNGVPGGYSSLLIEQADQLWLTVKKPKEKEAKK